MNELAALGDMLALAGAGYYVVDCEYPHGRTPWWFRATNAREVLTRFQSDLWQHEPMVTAAPYVHRGERSFHAQTGMLWAHTESGAAAKALRGYRPRPAVVLREGESVRYTAFWPLLGPARPRALDRANRQLAHALGCAKKWGAPSFAFWLPGTFVRRGRSQPLQVRLAFMEPRVFTLDEVTGRLPEPPDPNAWLERQRAKQDAQRAQVRR